MRSFLKDICHAFRQFGRHPGAAALCLASLALGIGTTAAAFSVLYFSFLLPVEHGEFSNLCSVWASKPSLGRTRVGISFVDWLTIQSALKSFERAAIYQPRPLTLTGSGEAEIVRVASISPGFFDVLGGQLPVGRPFLPDEYTLGRNQVTILSYGIWVRRFGGQASILGRTVVLSGMSCTVVGVAPPHWVYPPHTEMWLPLPSSPEAARHPAARWNGMVARLRKGAPLAEANEELKVVAARLAKSYPESDAGWSLQATNFAEDQLGSALPALMAVLAAAAALLAIACVHVGNILLSRALQRRREFAVRLALGATPFQIFRLRLTENALLAALGGALALPVFVCGVRVFHGLIPENVIGAAPPTLGWRVVWLVLAAVLVIGVVQSLFPAFGGVQPDAQSSLRGGDATGVTRRARWRPAIIALETCLTVPLLIATLLFATSFFELSGARTGMRIDDRLLVVTLRLPPVGLAGGRFVEYTRQVLDRLGTLPGVDGAAACDHAILQGNPELSPGVLATGGNGPAPPGGTFETLSVSPGFFRVLGIPLLAGRAFDEADIGPSHLAAVVNRKAATILWGSRNPIGQRVSYRATGSGPEWLEVVGVVGDTRDRSLNEEAGPEIYTALLQKQASSLAFIVRTASDARTLFDAVRQQISAVDRMQPIGTAATMDQILSNFLAPWRLRALVLFVFGGLGFVLATIGVYGVVSHSVSLRTREIAVRMALGASRRDVVRLVSKAGLVPMLIGTALGVIASVASARLVAGLVYGIAPLDPTAVVGAVAPLVLAGVLASYVPSRRASSIEPMATLRHE